MPTKAAPRTFEYGVKLYDQRATSGRWRVVWTDPATGRRRSAERPGEDEALAVVAHVVEQLSAPMPGMDNRRRKVKELVAFYFARPDARAWSKGYRQRQDSIVRTWVLPRLGELRCEELRPDLLRTILADAADAGRTFETLQSIASVLTGLVACGQEAGFIPEGADPARGIRKQLRDVRRAGETSRYLDPTLIPPLDKVEELADYMGGRWEWWRGLQVRMAAYTGLRLGELNAIRPADIQLEAGQVDVTRAWSAAGDGFTAPKWGRVRTTFLIPTLIEPLERRAAELDTVGDLLFPGKCAAALHSSRFTPAREALGWPRHPDDPKRWLWTWHSLRHVFCSWCLASQPEGLGLSATDVAYFAGHHSPAFTLERYTSRYAGSIDRARAAAAAVGR